MLCYAFYVCFVWLKTMIMSDFKDSIHYNAKQAILIFEKMKLLIIAALNGAQKFCTYNSNRYDSGFDQQVITIMAA